MCIKNKSCDVSELDITVNANRQETVTFEEFQIPMDPLVW